MANGGDLDKDGLADVLVSAPGANGNDGRVYVISGKTGRIVRSFGPKTRGVTYGSDIAAAGDLDRDGYPDVLIGAPNIFGAGYIDVRSGKTGKFLLTVSGPSRSGFGGAVAYLGDVTGDKRPDYCVYEGISRASAVLDGASGRTLFRIKPPRGTFAIEPVGSVQLGGSNIRSILLRHDRGIEAVYSAQAALSSDVHTIGYAARGRQQQVLFAPNYAGRPYIVLGSVSGTRPGIKLGSAHLRLNLDAYSLLSLSFPNSPLLVGSFGLLDRSGRARAQFVAIPQIPRAFVGSLVFHHAFLALGPTGKLFVSNSVPVSLTP